MYTAVYPFVRTLLLPLKEELCDWESALSLNSLRTLTWQILRECGAGGEANEDEDDPDGSARTVTGVCLPMFQVRVSSLPLFFYILCIGGVAHSLSYTHTCTELFATESSGLLRHQSSRSTCSNVLDALRSHLPGKWST